MYHTKYLAKSISNNRPNCVTRLNSFNLLEGFVFELNYMGASIEIDCIIPVPVLGSGLLIFFKDEPGWFYQRQTIFSSLVRLAVRL
jgi:hypothetical protein